MWLSSSRSFKTTLNCFALRLVDIASVETLSVSAQRNSIFVKSQNNRNKNFYSFCDSGISGKGKKNSKILHTNKLQRISHEEINVPYEDKSKKKKIDHQFQYNFHNQDNLCQYHGF